ncbi:MAG: hypothetical protein WAW63_01510 [Candidatus Saccharimonadales bacterium]
MTSTVSTIFGTKEQKMQQELTAAASRSTIEFWIEGIVSGIVMAGIIYIALRFGFRVQDDVTTAGVWIGSIGASIQTVSLGYINRKGARRKLHRGR